MVTLLDTEIIIGRSESVGIVLLTTAQKSVRNANEREELWSGLRSLLGIFACNNAIAKVISFIITFDEIIVTAMPQEWSVVCVVCVREKGKSKIFVEVDTLHTTL